MDPNSSNSVPVPTPEADELAGKADEQRSEEKMKKAEEDGRCLVKKMSRERFLNYIHDIIRKQKTPLHEIVRDHVLPFLPVRSLHRFRCVSRSWNNHISAPYFAHKQTFFHRSVSGMFLVCDKADPSSCYYPFDPYSANAIPDSYLMFLPSHVTQVRASTHGLLCCSGHFSKHAVALNYYICNPATEETWFIPTAPRCHYSVVLIVDSSPLNFCGDYDLVCSYYDEETRDARGDVLVNIKFEAFSSKHGVWSKSTQGLSCQERLYTRHGVSAGGKAYWRTTGGTIVYYDPQTLTCGILEIPENASDGSAVWTLGEHEGKLCCVVGFSGPEDWSVLVFTLQELRGEGIRWKNICSFGDVVGEDVRLLGFEGGEVVIWADGAVVGRNVETGGGRLLSFSNAPACEVMNESECLMYVSSLAVARCQEVVRR